MMNVLKRVAFLIAFTVMALGLSSQTVEEAGVKYNEGAQFYQAKNYSDAVKSFEEALNMADKAGPDADGLKANIQTQLINAYMRNGLDYYKEKDMEKAISELDKSTVLAAQTGNKEMEAKTRGITSKIFAAKGNGLLKDEKPDDAKTAYEKALELDASNLDALYGLELVAKSKGDMESMMKYADMVVENGSSNPKAADAVANAKSAATVTLLNEAAKALQGKDSQNAIIYINDSFKYTPGDADAYFNLALAYYMSKDYDSSIEAANKAIELKEGDKSGIYFQLGQALEGKGDSAGACDAYQKVISGPNVEAAKYQITQVLKCS
jgi:tetratricopeptide (TPR) repeat protein